MKRFAFSLVASLLTAVYWWAVFFIVYADALFSGDRNPALPAVSEQAGVVHNVVAIATGVLIYAVLTTLWHRATKRWLP